MSVACLIGSSSILQILNGVVFKSIYFVFSQKGECVTRSVKSPEVTLKPVLKPQFPRVVQDCLGRSDVWGFQPCCL